MGNRFGLYWFGAAGGSRTRTPIRTQAPQACQSTSSSTAADHSNSTSCLIIILRLALFVNSIFSPARKKTAKKVLTPGTSYGNIFLALNGAKPLARVVELVDSLASGASVRKDVRVRLPPRAPTKVAKKDATTETLAAARVSAVSEGKIEYQPRWRCKRPFS